MTLDPCFTADLAASTEEKQQRLWALRPRLLAFARMQLSHAHDAEDLVQETLTLAWQKLDSFRGESRFETWVFGILRHKLLDAIRARMALAPFVYQEELVAETDELFKENEQWTQVSAPAEWSEPEKSLEKDHFWQVFDICVYHLPDQTARVFTLRELIGMETDEICKCLEISEDNCWVILHRARLKLRACLERSWFLSEGGRSS